MKQSSASELTGSSDMTMDSGDSAFSPVRRPSFPTFGVAYDAELEAKVREASSLASSEGSKILKLYWKKDVSDLLLIFDATEKTDGT